MRRFIALVFAVLICLIPITASAAKARDHKPLTVVFGATTGVEGAPVGLEVTAAVIEQLRSSGQVEVMIFNPDLPNIARAVLENRLTKEAVTQPWEPKNAAKIAQVLKTEYALCIKGSVTDSEVDINLELLKVPSGGSWKANAQSQIAAGPRTGTIRSNAVSTAASSAVSQVLLKAFSNSAAFLPDKPRVEPSKAQEPAPVAEKPAQPRATASDKAEKPADKPAERPAQKPAEPSRDVTGEFNAAMKQVEAYMAKQDLRNAALALRQAINLDPENSSARLKLASVYADLGMTDDAIDECRRAALFHSDSAAISDMLVKLYLSDGRFAEAADHCRELIRLQPNNADARIALGDISWNQGKIADAEAAYKDALKADTKNMTAHGRLQKLYAARKMYDQALEHMLAMKIPSAEAEPDAGKRYVALAGIVRDEFESVVDKLMSARRDFEQGRMTREDYYQECKNSANRIDALASYLSTKTAPAGYKGANPHGVLATSLLSQASAYLVTFLETEKQHYRDQAVLLQNEARTEMDLFVKAIQRGG